MLTFSLHIHTHEYVHTHTTCMQKFKVKKAKNLLFGKIMFLQRLESRYEEGGCSEREHCNARKNRISGSKLWLAPSWLQPTPQWLPLIISFLYLLIHIFKMDFTRFGILTPLDEKLGLRLVFPMQIQSLSHLQP